MPRPAAGRPPMSTPRAASRALHDVPPAMRACWRRRMTKGAAAARGAGRVVLSAQLSSCATPFQLPKGRLAIRTSTQVHPNAQQHLPNCRSAHPRSTAAPAAPKPASGRRAARAAWRRAAHAVQRAAAGPPAAPDVAASYACMSTLFVVLGACDPTRADIKIAEIKREPWDTCIACASCCTDSGEVPGSVYGRASCQLPDAKSRVRDISSFVADGLPLSESPRLRAHLTHCTSSFKGS